MDSFIYKIATVIAINDSVSEGWKYVEYYSWERFIHEKQCTEGRRL